MKALLVILFWLLVLVAPTLVLLAISTTFGFPWQYHPVLRALGTTGGLLVGFIIIKKLFHHSILIVPDLRAVTTIDLFFKGRYVYGKGFFLKPPWEKVMFTPDLRNEITLSSGSSDTIEAEDETYPSEDSQNMVTSWILVLRILPGSILNYVQSKKNVIEQVFRAIAKQSIADKIGSSPADEIREHKRETSIEIQRMFRTLATEHAKKYGVEVVSFEVKDADYSKGSEAAREQRARAKYLSDAVKILKEGKPEMTDEMAIRAILANEGNASMGQQEIVIKGLENATTAIIGTIPGFLGGGSGSKAKKGPKQPK